MKKNKIQIIINIPNEIYLKENIQYRTIDFIEKTLNSELENIRYYKMNNTDSWSTAIILKIIK